MDRRMDRASRAARRRRRCPRGSFNNTGGDADGIVPPRPPVPTPSAHRVGASRHRGARRLLRPAKGSRYNRYSQGRRVTGSEAQGSRRRGHRRRRLGTRDVDRTVAAAAHPGGGSRAEGEAGEGRSGEGGAARSSGAQSRGGVRRGGRRRGNRHRNRYGLAAAVGDADDETLDQVSRRERRIRRRRSIGHRGHEPRGG